uniref:Uncharacterized protein n=1 Tax=uncultured Alphaproteobacteria bacterium TaxID=91750 RepID=A0A1B0Z322_9PROT|nr:hypothetical protein [uncultured Alphaproteobacteria bacterium]ANO58375.1 hypothetical protein [uncultured Alphaproteobacteria bacterium]
MTRDYRKGIGGILSLGPTPTKPKIINNEPDPYEDVFSLDAPVVLTPKETPQKEKKERTDKIYRYSEMMKQLTKPPSPYTREERKQIVKDFHKKREAELNAKQPKAKPMSVLKYISKINSLYGNSEETPEMAEQMTGHKKYPVTPEHFTDRIQEQDRSQKARKMTNTNKEKTDG